MARKTQLSLTTYTLNAVAMLGWLRNVTFDADTTLKSCKAINARYQKQRETKRQLTFTGDHKRRAAAGDPCETMGTITDLEIEGGSVLADCIGGSIDFTTVTDRADGGGDALATLQACGTDVKGTLELLFDSAATASYVKDIASSGSISTTLLFTDGVGSVELPIVIKGAGKTTGEGKNTVQTVMWEGDGTPTESGGTGTLFSLGLAGTASFAFTYNDGIEAIAGTALITQGSIKWSRDEITSENYSCHVNVLS